MNSGVCREKSQITYLKTICTLWGIRLCFMCDYFAMNAQPLGIWGNGEIQEVYFTWGFLCKLKANFF